MVERLLHSALKIMNKCKFTSCIFDETATKILTEFFFSLKHNINFLTEEKHGAVTSMDITYSPSQANERIFVKQLF